MRYLVGFVSALVVVPVGVSAQDAEFNAEELVPSSEPAPEAPALQLKLDEAGVGVAPRLPRTPDGDTLEEMELRVKRARIGLWSTAGATLVGLAVFGAGVARGRSSRDLDKVVDASVLVVSGMVVMITGAAGIITCGALLGPRKKELREARRAHYATQRRARWDLAHSRLLF